MVGDKKTDVDMGRVGGCRSILYANSLYANAGNTEADPDYRASEWREIADWILSAQRS